MDATQGVTVVATGFCCILGVLALLGGFYNFVHARNLERRCTCQVQGTVVDLVDEDFGKKNRRAKNLTEKDIEVMAANEEIAKKKRAYQLKKLNEQQLEADASAATWRPVVQYTVNGVLYEAKASRAVPYKRVKIGQATTVHYDPARPEGIFWLQLDGLSKGLGVMLMACGGAMLLMGAACWTVLPMIGDLSTGALWGNFE